MRVLGRTLGDTENLETGSCGDWEEGRDPASRRSSSKSADPCPPGVVLRPQSPPAGSVGSGPAARTPRVLSLRAAPSAPATEPLWGGLPPQPRVSPNGAVTTGSVMRGDNRDSICWYGGKAVVWGPQPLLYPQGGTRYLLSFPNVWECNVSDP